VHRNDRKIDTLDKIQNKKKKEKEEKRRLNKEIKIANNSKIIERRNKNRQYADASLMAITAYSITSIPSSCSGFYNCNLCG